MIMLRLVPTISGQMKDNQWTSEEAIGVQGSVMLEGAKEAHLLWSHKPATDFTMRTAVLAEGFYTYSGYLYVY